MKCANLLGLQFGLLTVVARGKSSVGGNSRWACLCSCGKSTEVFAYNLKSGGTISCGCYGHNIAGKRNKTHGDTGTPEHRVWTGMKTRCLNSKDASYQSYGAKGVTIDTRWLGKNGFETFLRDMGRRPSPDHSIERKKNSLGYSKENCCWATEVEQQNNRSNNVRLTFKGKVQTIAMWAREIGMQPTTLRSRVVKLGWSAERALTEPKRAQA